MKRWRGTLFGNLAGFSQNIKAKDKFRTAVILRAGLRIILSVIQKF
jgi:hypothetical protein